MAVRKAAFIGSEEWRKRDVEQVSGGRGNSRVSLTLIDKPTNISLTVYGITAAFGPSGPLGLLAHRVTQLTT